MPAEIKNFLVTIPLIIILVVMFFWLVKALLSGTGRDAAITALQASGLRRAV